MHSLPEVVLAGVVALSMAPRFSAHSNICQSAMAQVPDQALVEQLRIQAEERARQEASRANWTADIFPLQYSTTLGSLDLLCVYDIEVVPEPAIRLVAIRAPKELMPAVENALKRLDAPVAPNKSVELTGYVVLVSDSAEAGLQPLPNSLQSVANQLGTRLGGGKLYLADTVVARGIEGEGVQILGGTNLSAEALHVRTDTGEPVVHVDRFRIVSSGYRADFEATVDVPAASQVVVGKVTAVEGNNNSAPTKSVIFVLTASILN